MKEQPFTGGPGSARPGQMTAVMRAVLPRITGPKVLRIGLLRGGTVIEERVIKRRTHVTVSPSEKSTFLVSSPSGLPKHRLFELIGNRYHLNFCDGMTGLVALETGVFDLASLRAQAKRIAQGVCQVRLTEDARGKVTIGETTFLFQFVAATPVQPKPQLPVSVRGGLSNQIDWTLTIIASFSFLVHFGVVGAVYSDWTDSVIDDQVDIAGLIDSVKSLPAPPVETLAEVETAEKQTEKAPAVDPSNPAPVPAGKTRGSSGSRSKGEHEAIVAQLDQFEMMTVGALGSNRPATAGVLRNGEVPTGALDQVASSGAGVTPGGVSAIHLGGGGGPLQPGIAGGGLAGIGETTASIDGGAGPAAVVRGPKGNAQVGGAQVSGGSVSDADRVVARMRPSFHACYNKALATNPDLAGSVRIVTKVGPNGDVVTATPSGGSSLGADVVSCVVRRVMSATFAAPEGGGATIIIPVTFALQK